jgi:hypothetical protein
VTPRRILLGTVPVIKSVLAKERGDVRSVLGGFVEYHDESPARLCGRERLEEPNTTVSFENRFDCTDHANLWVEETTPPLLPAT